MSDASSVGLDILVTSWGLHVNMLHCRESSGMHRYVGVEGLDKPDMFFEGGSVFLSWLKLSSFLDSQSQVRFHVDNFPANMLLHANEVSGSSCNCSRDRSVVRVSDL